MVHGAGPLQSPFVVLSVAILTEIIDQELSSVHTIWVVSDNGEPNSHTPLLQTFDRWWEISMMSA